MNPFDLRVAITAFLPLRAVAADLLAQDAIEGILDDACDALADAGVASLHMSGFGQDPWPVDVLFDLPIVLEQLPLLVSALETQASATEVLDLYEQGIERTITFRWMGAIVELSCASRTEWSPSPEKALCPLAELSQLLRAALDPFVLGAEGAVPELASHPIWMAWRDPARSGEPDASG